MFSPATKIGLKKKLRTDLWKGPYEVQKVGDKGNIELKIGGKSKWENQDQTKKKEPIRTRFGRVSRPPDRYGITTR